MPSWTDVLTEIGEKQRNGAFAVDLVRRAYLAKLHEYTKRNVIAYYSSWLSRPPNTDHRAGGRRSRTA